MTIAASPRRSARLLTLLIVGVLAACARSGREELPDGPLLLPSLDLIPLEETDARFPATVIGQQNGRDIHSFTADEVAAGWAAPANAHVLYLAPSSLPAGLDVRTMHGGPALWSEVRYWGYEYSGNEIANRDAGKTGRALFDGRFWLSQGERNVTQDLYGYLHTLETDGSEMRMAPDKLYYLMVDGGAGTNGNPGLQGRPFHVCAGDSAVCAAAFPSSASSASTSAISSVADSSSVAPSSASSMVSSVASETASVSSSASSELLCGNGTLDPGEVCDDGNTAGDDECSADCLCDHGAVVDAFMAAHCAEAVTNEETLECYNDILVLWNGLGSETPPPIPDVNCSGTGDTADVLLLTPLMLSRYPVDA